MTRDEAMAKAATKWWEGKTAEEIVQFQLFEERLCMPFDLFHKAVEETLGRPVWTHEFADYNALQAELRGERAPEGPLQSLHRILKQVGREDMEVNVVIAPSSITPAQNMKGQICPVDAHGPCQEDGGICRDCGIGR